MIFLLSNPFTGILHEAIVLLNQYVSQWLPLPPSISSYSIAIVTIALVVKVVTYPLTAAQQRSMRKMAEIQPKIRELQELHKDDREKFAQAQMELFRSSGVNPFGGCLPLVIQLVVLFGLYQAINRLQVEGVLAGQRFLWIPDLSLCEPNPFCRPEMAVLPAALPILIIAMVASQMLYQRYLTPPSADPQAQAMAQTMKYMPLIFAFVFITLPSGLVLYYTAFNLISIAQYLLIDRRLNPPIAPTGAGAPTITTATAAESRKETRNDIAQSRRQRRKGTGN